MSEQTNVLIVIQFLSWEQNLIQNNGSKSHYHILSFYDVHQEACRSTELNRSVLLACTRILGFPYDSWRIPGILATPGIADHDFINCVCLLLGISLIIAVHPPTSMITFDGFKLLECFKFKALNDGSKRKIKCFLSWLVQDWDVTDVRLAGVSK